MSPRLVVVAALAIACHGALAQTATVPPAVTVQNLAPQLVTFAGSQANFLSLVNGLTGASAVQLLTVLPTGFIQSVSFTPIAALSPTQAAQVLEAARQQLIGLGIGAPTAEQIAFTLMGGVVPTALGGAQVPGVLNAPSTTNPPSPAAQIQAQAASGATAPTTTPTAATGVTNSVSVQTTAGTTPAATASVLPTNTSDSPTVPGTTSRSSNPFTSASPIFDTSASPLPTTPAAPVIAPPAARSEGAPPATRARR